MNLNIKFDGFKELFSKINTVQKRLNVHSPLLKKISILLHKSVMQNFIEERTDKEKWRPLSPTTIMLRRKGKGKRTPKILQDTGLLRRSIFPGYIGNEAFVSTNVPYASIHQFGAEKGSIARNVKVRIKEHIRRVKGKRIKVREHTRTIPNIPWGDVKARPFLVLRENYKEQIKRLFNQYMTGQEYDK
jgi:phage virion morphogenesis protein